LSGTSAAAPAALPEGFHLGVNMPWRSYGNDFGDNAWGVGGVADHVEEVDEALAEVADAGIAVVRWFVLTDGRAAVEFDADGLPTGVQDAALDDLSALLDLIEDHDLLLVPVLLDFGWCAPATEEGGVQMGGRCDVLATDAGREALVDLVLRPIFVELSDRPGLLAWDLVNEPLWAVTELGGGWLGDGVPLADMHAFTRLATAAAREETEQMITIGAASIASCELLWGHEELDLLQVHSYDGAALSTAAVVVDPDVPVVVGELGTSAEYGDLGANLSTIEGNGYAGAWPWSLLASDDASDLDLDEMAAWRDQ